MSYFSQNILPLAAYTASFTSVSVPVPTVTMLELMVRLTAAGGTTLVLDMWMEASPDNGANWYPMTADIAQSQAHTVAAAETAAVTNKRDVVDNAIQTTPATDYHGVYKHVPAGLVRLRGLLTGTGSPTATLEGWLVGK